MPEEWVLLSERAPSKDERWIWCWSPERGIVALMESLGADGIGCIPWSGDYAETVFGVTHWRHAVPPAPPVSAQTPP